MKKIVLTLAILLVAALGATAADTLKVQIPFDFTAATVTLPAGSYEIGPHYHPNVVAVRNAAGHVVAMVQTSAAISPVRVTEAKVVFNKYGDRCFISQVWVPGKALGREFRPARMERELMARGPVEQVLVSAVLR